MRANHARMRRYGHAVATLSVILLLASLCGCADSGPPRETVTLGGHQIAVLVADTHATRTNGLQGVDTLSDGEGMLFVYPSAQTIVFGIKDVGYPVEVVFIAEDDTVSAIERLTPGEDQRRVASPTPSRFALELLAGWCERNGVTEGSSFERR